MDIFNVGAPQGLLGIIMARSRVWEEGVKLENAEQMHFELWAVKAVMGRERNTRRREKLGRDVEGWSM